MDKGTLKKYRYHFTALLTVIIVLLIAVVVVIIFRHKSQPEEEYNEDRLMAEAEILAREAVELYIEGKKTPADTPEDRKRRDELLYKAYNKCEAAVHLLEKILEYYENTA